MFISENLLRNIITKAVKINNSNISEDLKYHIENDIGVDKNIFRPGSSSYFSVINEARILYKKGIYIPKNQEELFFLSDLDLGEFAFFEGKIVPLDFPEFVSNIEEAKYKGREVKLGKKGAQRIAGGRGRVYVRDKKTGKVKKVEFGSNMPDAMGDSDEDKKRRKNYGDRHNCSDKDDRTKPGYWSCRATKLFGRDIRGWW